MKRFNLIVLSLLSVAILIGCDKLEDIFGTEENPNNPQIEINTPEILSATDGGNNTIMFSATENWTAEILNSRTDGWCSIYPTSGNAGEATITVTTQPNDSPEERSASIIIKAGSVSKTVKVSQKQKDALTVTASKFEVGSDGGEVNIEIKANIDFQYEIEESAKDWVKYEGTRALKTSTLIFKVAENEDIEKRKAKIQIKSGELNEVVTIYQNGTKPTIIISKSEYVISANGETIAVDVTSNVDVAVELPIDADWVTENTTRALSTNTFYFDIAPSEEYEERTAEIVFTNSENNLSEAVKIVQTQKDALVVAKDSYIMESDGGQIQIEVGYNVNFDVEISADWITSGQTRAFTTETLIFNIAKNTDNDDREGAITFKSKDGSLTQTVKVYQVQADALIISDKDIVVGAESGTVSFEIQTNVEFKVSKPDVSWLRAVQTRGLTTHTFHYEYDANMTYDSREAKIVVTDIKNNQSEIITITQAQKDAIIVAKEQYSIGSKGDQIVIEAESNIDFDVVISNDWIKQITTRSLQSKSYTFEILQNTDKKDRQGFVKFVSQDETISQTVYINQACANGNTEDIENGDTNEW